MLNDQVSGPSSAMKPVLSNVITFCLEVVYATVEKVCTYVRTYICATCRYIVPWAPSRVSDCM